jgi:hypothetical protein
LKTVFFGPWIGEFGWEFSHWHAWVNQIAKDHYKNYTTIAASFSGRQPFYRDVDEFWAHPNEYNDIFLSQRNYIHDRWIGDRPINDYKIIQSKTLAASENNFIEIAFGLLEFYKKNLPKDTIFYVPWLNNNFRLNEAHYLDFGIEDLGSLGYLSRVLLKLFEKFFINRYTNQIIGKNSIKKINAFLYEDGILVKPIELSAQRFKKLFSHENEVPESIKRMFNNLKNKELIAIFPRKRTARRADKNFGKENYLQLIHKLKESYPDYEIALLGEPKGSYFANDDFPRECIDLININDNFRMPSHLYALQQSKAALGSISGALLIALAAECKSIIWGYENVKPRMDENNPLNTDYIYIGEMFPSIDIIMKEVKKIII